MIDNGAYNGQENQSFAESKNTELVTTALTGKVVAPIFTSFTFSDLKIGAYFNKLPRHNLCQGWSLPKI
ncbi:hypothetical protein [Eubacterium aggregans]|uniref:hypothetical protein n=1 Tax=Eubacterium aggregans TaxID=81409 RepID=UPI003F2AE4E3